MRNVLNVLSAVIVLVIIIFVSGCSEGTDPTLYFTPAEDYGPATDTVYSWNGSSWYQTSSNTYAYDKLGRLVSGTSINGFIDMDISNSYYSSGLLSKMGMYFLGTGIPLAEVWYSYNEKGLVTEFTGEINFITTGQTRSTITYNADDLPETEWAEQNTTGVWENTEFGTFYYLPDNKLDYTLLEEWSGTDWVNAERVTYTYDTFDRLETVTTEEWTGSAWEYDERKTYTYNADSSIDTITVERYTSSWNNYRQTVYAYTISNRVETKTTYSWNGSSWELFEKTEIVHTDSGSSYISEGKWTVHPVNESLIEIYGKGDVHLYLP